MKITIGSVLEYLIPNSYYMQLVWAKYLSLYKGNDCCRTKSFILLVERFLYFLFRFYYLSLLWEKIFYISLTSPAAVSCFCTKLFGICTKQNIFCTKDGGNSCMFFQNLPYFFIQTADFLGAFPVFLSERVRFSRLPIRFLRVFSTLSVMILLFLFHQSVFFSVFFW